MKHSVLVQFFVYILQKKLTKKKSSKSVAVTYDKLTSPGEKKDTSGKS